ncbi:I78 family peptidase inhibitor [Ramlibacter sp. H39-3-26]|uniref:I78 family peptidase inhibitor n=1 Tax=Curvibacter soli TaxID=3031331 RepID=UPI0023DA9E30|nr:I78 family peptidase inhibitor [Ramlibacter sp. H39-3-26]MDF1483630.1 I78 family peptidase inhibitor [Ramlibacter sp. H39-3-26]
MTIHGKTAALAAVSALLLATGCGTQPPGPAPAPDAPPVGGLCDAQGPAQSAIGKTATAQVVETARARSGAHIARVLRPGQVVTLEFNTERVNLVVDGAGVVTAVRCG